jgi:hypothetical protein
LCWISFDTIESLIKSSNSLWGPSYLSLFIMSESSSRLVKQILPYRPSLLLLLLHWWYLLGQRECESYFIEVLPLKIISQGKFMIKSCVIHQIFIQWDQVNKNVSSSSKSVTANVLSNQNMAKRKRSSVQREAERLRNGILKNRPYFFPLPSSISSFLRNTYQQAIESSFQACFF